MIEYLQIFLSSPDALLRRSVFLDAPSAAADEGPYNGGAVPPGGPLTRLLSVIYVAYPRTL